MLSNTIWFSILHRLKRNFARRDLFLTTDAGREAPHWAQSRRRPCWSAACRCTGRGTGRPLGRGLAGAPRSQTHASCLRKFLLSSLLKVCIYNYYTPASLFSLIASQSWRTIFFYKLNLPTVCVHVAYYNWSAYILAVQAALDRRFIACRFAQNKKATSVLLPVLSSLVNSMCRSHNSDLLLKCTLYKCSK